MDIATIKKDLENQIGDINKELKNIYLPLEAVLILLGKRTAFQIALGLIDSFQREQKPAGRSKEDSNIAEELYEYFWHLQFESDKEFSPSLSFDEVLEWLKSLRPSWKPSEEQMRFLLAVINEPNNAGSESCHIVLNSLYHDLKNLK